MKRARLRLTLLVALSLLTAGVALVGSSTSLASEPAEPREHHDEEAPRNLTLAGEVRDAETGEPVVDAEMRIYNLWIDEDGDTRGRDVFNVETDEDGTYSVDVSRGQIRLHIDHGEHQLARADFQIEDDLELDIPMEPVSEDRARIEGTVTNDEGDPLEEAHVRLSWIPEECDDGEHEEDCERRHTAVRSTGERSGREVRTEQGSIEITYEPRDDRYVTTQTDAEGGYAVHVPEGSYDVRVDADGHLSAQTSLEADANETKRTDVSLTPIPPASVTVEGQIVDQATGEGIEAAEIRLDNQKWGTRNTTLADEEGNFQLAIEPGYTTIQIRAGESYYVPCEDPDRAHTATTSSRNGSSSEHDDGARPAKDCEPRQQRDTAYMPVSTTIQPDADATIQLDEELKPEPEPDTHLEGWVTNASSGEGVADATIYVSNEETEEWGRAETGEDGSFRIALDEGYYTVRLRAEGYFANATNLEIDGQRQVTLSLTPGEPADRRYHAVAHDDVAYEAEDGGDDGVATRDTAAPSSSPSGEERYEGGPAELGSPPTAVSGQPSGQPVPSLSVLVLVGGLAGAALMGAAIGRVRTRL